MRKLFYAAISVAICHGILRADVESGPKAGEKVGDFNVFGVTGPVEGKEVSYVKERKDEPTVFVFVQQEHWDRPMARFLKTLDKDCKEADEKAQVVAVWLTEKPDAAKDYLPKANMSLQFANTALTVFTGEKSGPNGWGINIDAHVTVVVASKSKVIASFAFQSVNETDAGKVKDAIKKAGAEK
jgi:hypothetical protein